MNGETILLIGEITMVVAVAALAAALFIFRSRKQKLNILLENKYGKKRK